MNSMQRYLTKDLVLVAIAVAIFSVIIGGCTTALHRAIQKGDISAARDYLDKGGDVNAVKKNAALCVAAQSGKTEIVKLLIDSGADVNAIPHIWTPLMLAAERGHTEIIKLLIDSGADVNAITRSAGLRNTALCAAAERGHNEIVKLLIDNGANVETADRNGVTALSAASYRGHTETIKLLMDGLKVPRGSAIFISFKPILIRWPGQSLAVIYDTYGGIGDHAIVRQVLPGTYSLEAFYWGGTYKGAEPIPFVFNAESGHIYVVRYKVIEEPTEYKKGKWTAWIEKYK